MALTVAMFLQAFLEKLLGNDTGLWQAIHPLLYFAVDIAIRGGFVPEVVVLVTSPGMSIMRSRMYSYLAIGVFK
jgi:hypothetical protein